MIVNRGETPPPNPTDLALVKPMDAWARTVSSTTTAAGKAKAAYLAWKKANRL